MKLPAAILIIAGGFIYSCTRDKGRIKTDCNAPATVSFKADLIPLFRTNCSLSGCHTGSSPTGNLNLDEAVAYQNLMKRGSGYIDTLHPELSLLYSQMISTSQPMPPTGNLSACQTSLVLTWIRQNAKNN